jgi:hypothetical protein
MFFLILALSTVAYTVVGGAIGKYAANKEGAKDVWSAEWAPLWAFIWPLALPALVTYKLLTGPARLGTKITDILSPADKPKALTAKVEELPDVTHAAEIADFEKRLAGGR